MQSLPNLRQMDNAAAHLQILHEVAFADTGKKHENALAELSLLSGGNL
jgi:hypothetical protein